MTQAQIALKKQQDVERFLAYSKTIGLAKPFTVAIEANGSWNIKFLKK